MNVISIWFASSILLPYPSRIVQFKPVPVPIETGTWTRLGTPLGPMKPDYLNETASHDYYWLTPELGADDVHRISADSIIAIDLGYYTESSAVDATVYFYSNTNDYQVPPPPVASFMFADLPGGTGPSVQFVHLALPQPVNVPADIWLGVKWDDPTGRTGLIVFHPPSLGTSHFFARLDGDGDHILETLLPGQSVIPNFFIGTYVPCPDPPCGGDLNLDGRIDGADINLFVRCALGYPPEYFPCFRADLDENGLTDDADAALLVGRLLTAP